MLNTFYDSFNVLTKVYSEKAYLKQAMNTTVIEERNRSNVTKICYGVLDKDVSLQYYLACLCDKMPKTPIRILLKISMYSMKYLGNAPYAVVDNCVKLVKKLGKGGTAGFVNAVLRKFSSKEIDLPKDKFERYSVEYSYPLFAVKRLVKDYGEKTALGIISYDKERTFVRFNKDIDGENYLISGKYNYEKTPFSDTFAVSNFKRNADYDSGIYTFQSVGSVAICDCVGKGKILLDACAAPGGKSVKLADCFEKVISCDVHLHRVELIKEYAKRMGKENIEAVCLDSSVKYEEYSDKFDVVLADVPCSGFGVVKDNPDIKLNRKDENVDELAKQQYKIICNLSSYVKKGGYLIYSTCSVFQTENEGVTDKFLAENKDFKAVECDSGLPHLKMKNGIQFLPNLSLGAGFYCCKFIRV